MNFKVLLLPVLVAADDGLLQEKWVLKTTKIMTLMAGGHICVAAPAIVSMDDAS